MKCASMFLCMGWDGIGGIGGECAPVIEVVMTARRGGECGVVGSHTVGTHQH